MLHHVGPLAGAALLAGAGGTLLFGALGLLAAIPMLLRMHRRSGSWRRPAAALALFTALFALSSFVIGPALTQGSEDAPAPAEPTTTEPTQPAEPAEPTERESPAASPRHKEHH